MKSGPKKRVILFYLLLSIVNVSPVFSQDTIKNKYGLRVITTKGEYLQSIEGDPQKKMVDLAKFIPGLIIELKYAGKDNFWQEKLYPATKTTYLRQGASIALKAVQEELSRQHLSVKVWDAYRPYSVTERMWETVRDERYAADPKFGSGHNRGIAIDLTIVDLVQHRELNMGTGFDHFSDSARHGFKYLPENIIRNRLLLRSVMEKHGFKALESEWWHYYLPDPDHYELMNFTFEEFQQFNND